MSAIEGGVSEERKRKIVEEHTRAGNTQELANCCSPRICMEQANGYNNKGTTTTPETTTPEWTSLTRRARERPE